jgi:hypothetical protein
MDYEAARLLTHERLHETWVWQSVDLRSWPGVLLLSTVAALIFVLRRSKRRIHPVQAILLLLAAAGMLVSSYAVRWFAPIVALVLVRHAYDAIPQFSERFRRRAAVWFGKWRRAFLAAAAQAGLPTNDDVNSKKKSPFAFVFTLLCGVTVWTCFVFSPSGHVFLGGSDENIAATQTEMPRAAGEYLRRRPNTGIVCAPADWSDWLTWHLGPKTQVAINSNSHRLPPSVWDDFQFVSTAGPSWEKPLDNYRVTSLVVDKVRQYNLAEAVRGSAAWDVVFEDDKALVAQRVPAVKSG